MRCKVLLPLLTVALLGAACSEAPDTIVVGSDGVADAVSTTVPGQRPAEQSTSTSNPRVSETQATPEQETPILQQSSESTTTVNAEIEPEPDPLESIEREQPWEDHPLARVILTADDMPALGLDSGWEFNWVDFIELDPADHVDEEVCGASVPVQPSYFVVSFDDEAVGMELQLNVMPDMGGPGASDFLQTLELLVDCPNPEPEYANVNIEIVAIEVDGAEQSLVITGADESSPGEPLGITLAAAEVDGHLFIAFVEQDSGSPASGDAELAVKALELSISRL